MRGTQRDRGTIRRLGRFGRGTPPAVVAAVFATTLAVFTGASAVAQDCDLLVASFGNDKIMRYSGVDGSLIGTFVPTGGGGLDGPHALTIGPDGHVYAASLSGGDVMRYDGTTGASLPGPAGGAGTAEFVPSVAQPSGVIFGPDGNLYVSLLGGSRVLRYDGVTGVFIDTFVSTGSGGLNGGELMAFGADGHLYMGSLNNAAVMRYDGTTGAPLAGPGGAAGTAQFVTPGSGGLANPHGVRFGPDGDLYVSSFGNGTVKRYDGTTGAFVETFATGVPSSHGLVFRSNGHLLAVGFGSSAVQEFDASGTLVGNFVTPGLGGLASPADAAYLPCAAACPADIDGDGMVGFGDVVTLLADWGPCDGDCPADLDGSGDVGFGDLVTTLAAWGPCPD